MKTIVGRFVFENQSVAVKLNCNFMKKELQYVLLLFFTFTCICSQRVRGCETYTDIHEESDKAILVDLVFSEGITDNSGYFGTWSSNDDLTVILSNPYKNMLLSGNNIILYRGQSVADYKLTAPAGYNIDSYAILFRNNNVSCDMTVSSVDNGEYVTCKGSESAILEVVGLNEPETSISVNSTGGINEAVVVECIIIKICPSGNYIPNRNQLLFSTHGADYPYRIPALAVTGDSSVIAVSDYRPCKADIGAGDVDVHMRISTDNAVSWNEECKVLDGTGSGNTAGYGDVAIVADRESDKVLMVVATGDVIFGRSGTFLAGNRKMRMAYCVSEDNGNTWSLPKDITDHIYSRIDVLGAFFTSGRILQSRIIKKADYYRIYSVLCVNNNILFNGDKCNNIVLYSDDFGETWNTLGGIAITGGNEAKCEELPDGNLVISSRRNGGRKFNIFRYTDFMKAEGAWQTAVESNAVGSVISGTADCNGELLMVDAVRNSDGVRTKVLLQSVPVSSQREKVGIFYKELSSLSDYETPQNIAKDWNGPYIVSNTFSAYSTMQVLPDNYIGFFYEETVVREGYQMKFRKISLDEITGGEYTLISNLNIEKGERKIIGETSGTLWLELESDRNVASEVLSENGDTDITGATVDYTFISGESSFLSFPADIDLREDSNLGELGYQYGGNYSKNYTIKELNQDTFGEKEWTELGEPVLKKNIGYLIRISDNGNNGVPVNVEFIFKDRRLSDSVNGVPFDFGDSLDYTETSGVFSGLNMLGNPYLSTIDLKLSGALGMKDISGFFYKYDYEYDIFIPYDLNSVSSFEVSPFSTYVLHVFSGESEFTVNPESMVGMKYADGRVRDNVGKKIGLQLSAGDSRIFCDRTLVVMSDDGNSEFVPGKDALKLWGGFNGKSSELASYIGDVEYSVNYISSSSTEIPLKLILSDSGKYYIEADMVDGFDGYDSVFLYDKIAGVEYDLLADNGGYEFYADGNHEIPDRFALIVKMGCETGIDSTANDNILFEINGNVCHISNLEYGSEIKIYDLSGNIVSRNIVKSYDWNQELADGFYVIEVYSDGNRILKKIIIG